MQQFVESRESMELKEYDARFSEYHKVITEGIKNLWDLFDNYQKNIPSFEKIGQHDNSIELKIWSFDIKIVFHIKVTEDRGYIRWYCIYDNEETQRKQGKMIFEHYFDYAGNILEKKGNSRSTFSLSYSSENYFLKNILAFCREAEKE